jgi:hypothetical protein
MTTATNGQFDNLQCFGSGFHAMPKILSSQISVGATATIKEDLPSGFQTWAAAPQLAISL